MTAFFIGMMAAGLWLTITAVLLYLRRHSPGPPERSIEGFRRARKRMAPAKAGEPAPAHDVSPDEARSELTTIDLTRFDVPVSIQDLVAGVEPGEQERSEVDDLLTSVRAAKRPPKPRKPPEPRTEPRRKGKTTYVWVDDQGNPEL